MKKIFLTKTGLIKLEQEYQQLTESRPDAVANLKTAREMGDLSENAAYRVARSKLSGIDSRLRYLAKILRQAVVQEKPNDGRIGIGSNVKLEVNGKIINYEIVGSIESDLGNGKLSASSPVGKRLVGNMKGDEIRVIIPGGETTYKILAVI